MEMAESIVISDSKSEILDIDLTISHVSNSIETIELPQSSFEYRTSVLELKKPALKKPALKKPAEKAIAVNIPIFTANKNKKA